MIGLIKGDTRSVDYFHSVHVLGVNIMTVVSLYILAPHIPM